MTRPLDIQSSLLWYREEKPNGVSMFAVRNPEGYFPGCRVYWGSHGCQRPVGHEGDCWCDCCDCANHPDEDSGCVAGPPYYGPDTMFYGEDAEARGLNTEGVEI